MRVFTLRAADLTDNYHPSGGLVVVARDETHAREMVDAYGSDEWDRLTQPTDGEWARASSWEIAGDAEPEVFVYPNAGCC